MIQNFMLRQNIERRDKLEWHIQLIWGSFSGMLRYREFNMFRRFLLFKLALCLLSIQIVSFTVQVSAQTYRTSSLLEKKSTDSQAVDFPVGVKACQLDPFVLFEGADINDLTGIDAGCPDVLDVIMENINSLTSTNFYYFSEIEDLIGGAQNLPCFLKAVSQSAFGAATLVIDKAITLEEPLVIPSRFTLAGTGIDGEGQLRFTGLAEGVSAIRLDNEGTDITIRDISIGGVDNEIVIGIDVSRANKVFIRDVMVTGFYAGIYGSRPGTSAISVYLDRCSVFDNDFNIVIHRTANHWRIQNCILKQALCWGLYVFGPQDDPAFPPVGEFNGWGNDHLVSGCRFEDNGHGGISLGSFAAMLQNNRFQLNGGSGGVGVRIINTATGTRMMSNLFSGNTVIDNGRDTQRWGDIRDKQFFKDN